MKMLVVAALTAVVGCFGCINKNPIDNEDATASSLDAKRGVVRYLVVGMESSKRFGLCPGCETDAKKINSLLSDKFGYKGDMLISSQATKNNVVSKLRDGISQTKDNDMFIFCYSGHGGQEYLGGKEPDGAEYKDEYLCLYDTYMQDDEIWEIISKRKGRVFLYFDACHSATMYRSVLYDNIDKKELGAKALDAGPFVWSSGFEFHPDRFCTANALEYDNDMKASSKGMLCWSGCKEIEYSYGGSSGGVMTSALINNWKKGITYSKLWSLIVKDVQSKQPTQHPVNTVMGFGFEDDVEAFR